jgi:type IV secretory pathway VirB2 component (pilin)
MNLDQSFQLIASPFMDRRASPHQLPILLAVVLLMLAVFMPGEAAAQTISVPFIQDFGCSIVSWLKGPLAIVVFVIVVVVTLVFGMISKMDWGKIITVCIIFGVLLGLGSILANSGYINNIAGMSACLQ